MKLVLISSMLLGLATAANATVADAKYGDPLWNCQCFADTNSVKAVSSTFLLYYATGLEPLKQAQEMAMVSCLKTYPETKVTQCLKIYQGGGE